MYGRGFYPLPGILRNGAHKIYQGQKGAGHIEQLIRGLLNHIKGLWLPYLFFFLAFMAGLFGGYLAPSSMDAAIYQELSMYYQTILQGLPTADFNLVGEFKNAFLFNGGLLFLLWLSGLTALGFVFVFPILFYKGFTLGFSISFVLSQRIAEGMVILLLTILPQTLLLIPLLFLGAMQAAGFSLQLIRRKDSQTGFGRQFMVYSSRFALLLAGVVFCSIVQGLLAPYLLELFFAVL